MSVESPGWSRRIKISLAVLFGLACTAITFVPQVAKYRLSLFVLLLCSVSFLFALAWMIVPWRGWKLRSRLLGSTLLVLCTIVAAILIDPRLRVRAGLATFEFAGDNTPLYAWKLDWWRKATQPAAFELPPADTPPVPGQESLLWPGVWGAERNGIVPNVSLETDWKAHPPQLKWQRPIGPGWSSFAVAGGLAITQEHREDGGEYVVAWHLATGRDAWSVAQPAPAFHDVLGGDGPRATPTIDGDDVYALSVSGRLDCLALKDGELRWSTNILTDAQAKNLQWGMSGSPLVTEELVIVNPGGKQGHSVAAYNKTTGALAWHSGDGQAGYCSPVLLTIGDTEQVLLLNGPALEGYRLADGKPLWSYPWVVDGEAMISASQPIILPRETPTGTATTSTASDEAKIFITGGYGKGCVLVSVRGIGEQFTVSEVWEPNRTLKAKFSSPVYCAGSIYGLDDGILTCLDPLTGERHWKKGRYGFGQLLVVGNVLLIQAENGNVHLVQPETEELTELAKFSPLAHKTWTYPALAGSWLLVRNSHAAACYALPLAK